MGRACGRGGRHVSLIPPLLRKSGDASGRRLSFRYPFKSITFLQKIAITPCQKILVCNSSLKPSHSLHDWRQIVFYAFKALLILCVVDVLHRKLIFGFTIN
ncbi:hypothetical protein ETA_18540 [Erwinia tasmaniensis Et1/99]|uniref:Uncharacterized protein n=1 Tax=Erwinia tasmaniensis (strain DSM 17950 / CFBP 7177 / CIP 109463 / NCPPB 4357 / Et1/99) TaxID=465817 RepID=B2VEK4_ERWT9|nr:hypothetical protein ETA_18540 [Erwinia tasmaniensis Et1/99]